MPKRANGRLMVTILGAMSRITIVADGLEGKSCGMSKILRVDRMYGLCELLVLDCLWQLNGVQNLQVGK